MTTTFESASPAGLEIFPETIPVSWESTATARSRRGAVMFFSTRSRRASARVYHGGIPGPPDLES
jgi:hypothetical protein